MKAIFISLLLLNVGFYVWQARLASAVGAPPAHAERDSQEREIELLPKAAASEGR